MGCARCNRQLTTVRWLGTFFEDPLDVPAEVVGKGARDVSGPTANAPSGCAEWERGPYMYVTVHLGKGSVVSWQMHNLTQASQALKAIDEPASHVVQSEGTQHVFHRADLGGQETIVELWWSDGAHVHWGDLLENAAPEIRGGFHLPPYATHVLPSDQTQHVFYSSGAAFEIWWSGGESAQVGNLCKAAGHEDVGAIGLSSHVFGVEGTQHVFGRGSGIINPQAGPVTNHVIEFWWTGPEAPHLEDLNDRAKSPFLADSATSCHTLELGPGGPSTQSVFYRSGRDIIRLTFRDGQWTSRNLSTSSAGEFTFASGSPASHAVAADGTHHVFYIGAEDRHIYEFSWTDNTNPVGRDLSAHAHGNGPTPLAASSDFIGPTSHVFAQQGTQHVYYVDVDGNIIELWWWPGQDPTHENLTVQSGGAPLASPSKPASHVFVEADRVPTQHVFYTSTDADLIELWWRA